LRSDLVPFSQAAAPTSNLVRRAQPARIVEQTLNPNAGGSFFFIVFITLKPGVE